MDPTTWLKLKLQARDTLSPRELDAISALVELEVTYAVGEIIVEEDVRQTRSQLMVSGVAARSKAMADGRRQITELHIAGDFVDLHSFLLKSLEHDVIALSPVRMALVPHERLAVVTEQAPHLTRMLWLSTLIDAAIHREWIVSAGRRTALQQVACLFCEIMTRYQIIGLGEGDVCLFPITQSQLADACGITAVHVNRVLQALRGDGLIDWRHGQLAIKEPAKLAALGEFDPSYLSLKREPR